MTEGMMADTDVLIVGAGRVGLTAACELARHGVRARIVERLTEPTRHSRAAAVQPRTLESLEPLGLPDELISRGSPQRTFDTYGGRDGTRHLARFDMANIASRYRFVLDIRAARRSARRAAGRTVERGVAVSSLRDEGDRVVAVLESAAGTEEVTAEWVLGADGASSVVRHSMGLRWLGSEWVSVAAPGQLVRLDPASGQVVATVDVGPSASFLALTPDAVWVISGSGTVSRVDPPRTP